QATQSNDAFIFGIFLDVLGADLHLTTQISGENDDFGRALAVDSAGNLVLVGSTNSTTGIATPGTFQGGPGNSGGAPTGFVVTLSGFVFGGGIMAGTYYGGNDSDGVNGVALAPSGEIFVAGVTTSNDLTSPDIGALKGSLVGTPSGFIAN